MQGHAGANMVPLIASNRIGTEKFESSSITFYGGSFILGQLGEVVAQVGPLSPKRIVASHQGTDIEL